MGVFIVVLVLIVLVGWGLSMIAKTLNGAAGAIERATARRNARRATGGRWPD